jgi:hypothetical protein
MSYIGTSSLKETVLQTDIRISNLLPPTTPEPQVMSRSSSTSKVLVVSGCQEKNLVATRRFQGPAGKPRTYSVPAKGKQS